MTLDELIAPLDDTAPCGPDLNATIDPQFDEYYFSALARLPSFFFRAGVGRSDNTRSPDQIFDRKSVALAQESNAINALLVRSRDLRLLVLRAQWEMLVGQLGPCATSFEAIAGLISTYTDEVHPSLPENLQDRRDALADLNAQVTMVQPLQFHELTGTNETSLRKIRVAKGLAAPLANEHDVDFAEIESALKDPSTAPKVVETHADLMRMRGALRQITEACKNHPKTPFTPAFGDINGVLEEMLDVITSARPDLRSVSVAPPTEPPEETQTTPAPSSDAGRSDDASHPGPLIENHAHARSVLQQCERYYTRAEPSSAALLLVTQARLLIGRPMVEAMEALLPQKMSDAAVDFGPQLGFSLNYERLKQLTENASAPEQSEQDAQVPPTVGKIETGSQAAIAIDAVETYFRKVETTSPVPVLLQRARSYIGRDFQSLMDELMPPVPKSEG